MDEGAAWSFAERGRAASRRGGGEEHSLPRAAAAAAHALRRRRGTFDGSVCVYLRERGGLFFLLFAIYCGAC